VLHARLDSTTSVTALPNVLASQERGFASSTFGEIRNRADLIVYWAIDLATRYPRFVSRYACTNATVAAIDVGDAVASVDAGHRFSIGVADELPTLLALRAPATDGVGALFNDARYVALVYDAEPDDRVARSPQRFDALLALSHALNDRTHCVAIGMRGFGNISGADAVFTAATGYPIAIDFARGYPRYRPHERSEPDVVVVVGDHSSGVYGGIDGVPVIAIGPNAILSALGPSHVAIDTGAAGIHTAGTAVRGDEVPLPLRPPLRAGRSVGDMLTALLAAVR
jgi:formylmethanofuran dehydrogenase subunit B